jgi:hypothetical protein
MYVMRMVPNRESPMVRDANTASPPPRRISLRSSYTGRGPDAPREQASYVFGCIFFRSRAINHCCGIAAMFCTA